MHNNIINSENCTEMTYTDLKAYQVWTNTALAWVPEPAPPLCSSLLHQGYPKIMLEAMACGTPVLATPVGTIPDVIADGKTGFIVQSNSPECIAENVMRALNSPDLEQIAESGRRFVKENFTFERVAARWKEVLDEI